jgi:hypothetical protein
VADKPSEQGGGLSHAWSQHCLVRRRAPACFALGVVDAASPTRQHTMADRLHRSVLLLDAGVGGWGRYVELLRAVAPPTVLSFTRLLPSALATPLPYLAVGLRCRLEVVGRCSDGCWPVVVSHYSRVMVCMLSFHRKVIF